MLKCKARVDQVVLELALQLSVADIPVEVVVEMFLVLLWR